VPPGKSELKLLLHCLAADNLIGIVVFECERICTILALVRDFAYIAEKFTHFKNLRLYIMCRCGIRAALADIFDKFYSSPC
jgi:hypothetical protein